MYYGGIDLASKTSAVSVVDSRGTEVRRCEVTTQGETLRQALSGLGPLTVVIEASPLAEWASREVELGGHRAVIVDARAAKRLMQARKKTDARDALTLARLARSGWYRPVHRKSAQARLGRSQLQARRGLVRTYQAMASQVRGLLRAHGVRVGRVSAGRFSDRVRELAAAQEPELQAYLEPLLTIYDTSLAESRRLKRLLSQAGRHEPVQRHFRSTPGVGPLTAYAYVVTIDDPRRFSREEEVSDYVGLAPGVNQSGESCHHGPITREGDELLRWHLVEAAQVLLSRGADCRLKRWGLRLARRKGMAKARVAVARKLAIVLWRMWLTGESFEPERGALAT